MSFSVNGQQSCVPPGFRFHPTEEELLNYYLRKKVSGEKIDLDVIRDVDLNRLEPWDIEDRCRVGSTPQNDWYFFSHKDKKYPTGTRTNRATAAGFWKATGRDKVIHSSFRRIGMRKTLVFYRGRAPHGQKSDWIMHEYRLDDHSDSNSYCNASSLTGETAIQEDGWVVCRVFKKKNLHKSSDSNNNSSSIFTEDDDDTQIQHSGASSNEGPFDQILQCMGRPCKQESDAINIRINPSFSSNHLNSLKSIIPMDTSERFTRLPSLQCLSTFPSTPTDLSTTPGQLCSSLQTRHPLAAMHLDSNKDSECDSEQGLSNWAALDRLIAFHLNGQSETSKLEIDDCFDDPSSGFSSSKNLISSNQDYHIGDVDLWSVIRSASSTS